jgi:oligopeptide/dipeptide ABC transporter ATP-binding protein
VDAPSEQTVSAERVLEIVDLRTQIPTPRGTVRAVEGVSLTINAGERVALVGESGSGKTMTAMSVLGLLPRNAQVEGSIRFRGRELVGMPPGELAAIRGRSIGAVFQNPLAALDPVMKVGRQVGEPLRIHRVQPSGGVRAAALRLLQAVQISDAERRMEQYPHELSGGMNQRAVIATSLACEPDLLIADEPTTALDTTTQATIMRLLEDVTRERRMAVLLITHDLGLVADVADRVAVMYAGRVVEHGTVTEVLRCPRHPYTRGLLRSAMDPTARRAISWIPGTVPDLRSPPSGCAFHPRCHIGSDRPPCLSDVPPLEPVAGDHLAACHFVEEVAATGDPDDRPVGSTTTSAAVAGAPVLEARELTKHFRDEGLASRGKTVVRAVDGVSFSIADGETLALVGESGSGKSTIARLVVGLETPTSGEVVVHGTSVGSAGRRDLTAMRRRVQIVFQDPSSSLDPRMTVQRIVTEPLVVHGIGTKRERAQRAAELLELVGLEREHLAWYPYQFSGGQKQRIAIARALALEPSLLVCDEPVTALDASVRGQVLTMLASLRERLGIACLFITHDLGVVRQIADRIAVMHLGELVELSTVDDFFAGPRHPYSVALLAAVPTLAGMAADDRVLLRGDPPSPSDPPPGCRFHTRCWKAQALCREVPPVLEERPPGRRVACHFPEEP